MKILNLVPVAILCLIHVTYGVQYEVIHTLNEYNYIPSQYDFSRHRYVVFEVKACNDAHINLMADVNNDISETYEIVIGGWANSKSVIRRSKQERPPRAQRYGSYLNCNEFRRFWISWTGYSGWTTIRVGTTPETTDQTLMYFHDSNPYPINAVSVSTGWGATGDWRIYDPLDGPRQCCQTHPSGGNQFCIVPGLDCQFYTQQDITHNPHGVTYLQRCALNTRLDLALCICNHKALVSCNV